MLGLLIVLILMGTHIGVALAICSGLGVWLMLGSFEAAVSILGNTAYEAVRKDVFAVIPLFVLMGDFISRSGAASDLYRICYRTLKRIPGRLAIATIAGNTVFAAVIPRWFESLCRGESPRINGDGETSRDFCFIDNTVQANLLAATATHADACNTVYNVAVGGRTSLNELFGTIRQLLAEARPALAAIEPEYGDFRPGDVRHSQADISRARDLLGYAPTHTVAEGLAETCAWFLGRDDKE